MEIKQLRHFLVVSRLEHVGLAAEELTVSASLVSKSIRKLEAFLGTHLFDRHGRSLRLNETGRRLAQKAGPLVAEFDQVASELLGPRSRFVCRIAGPALLQLKWGRDLVAQLSIRYPGAAASFGDQSESEAVQALEDGSADLALVTDQAFHRAATDIESVAIGVMRFALAVGEGHPLEVDNNQADVDAVLAHDFVVPTKPHFQALGHVSDGWQDALHRRKIRYRSDDLLMVDGLVRRNMALAYLPDYVIEELGLHAVTIRDNPNVQRASVHALYRPSRASGWMNWLTGVAQRLGEAASKDGFTDERLFDLE